MAGKKTNKSHPFNALSNTICINPGCDRRIKERFIARGDTGRVCYKCYMKAKKGKAQVKPTQ